MKRCRTLFLFMALCLGLTNCRKLSFDDELQGRAGDIVSGQQSKEKAPNSDNIETGHGRKFVPDDSSAPPACSHNGDGDLPYMRLVVNTGAGGEKK